MDGATVGDRNTTRGADAVCGPGLAGDAAGAAERASSAPCGTITILRPLAAVDRPVRSPGVAVCGTVRPHPKAGTSTATDAAAGSLAIRLADHGRGHVAAVPVGGIPPAIAGAGPDAAAASAVVARPAGTRTCRAGHSA